MHLEKTTRHSWLAKMKNVIIEAMWMWGNIQYCSIREAGWQHNYMYDGDDRRADLGMRGRVPATIPHTPHTME